MDYELGCRMPAERWHWLNRTGIFEDPKLQAFVAPFPPKELMSFVGGSTEERKFAEAGTDFFMAISTAAGRPLTEFKRILDFGCGCGRFLRMLKRYPHELFGCDVDPRHIEWVRNNLSYATVIRSNVNPPLPYANDRFDCVVSISVFSHLNEKSQDRFLRELRRITMPGARLMLSIHGQRALTRALHEKRIRDLICVDENLFQEAQIAFRQGKHAFILQQGHLTYSRFKLIKGWVRQNLLPKKTEAKRDALVTQPYEYGITFIPEAYVRSHWSRWFDVLDYRPGAIHDFQDLVVLQPKK